MCSNPFCSDPQTPVPGKVQVRQVQEPLHHLACELVAAQMQAAQQAHVWQTEILQAAANPASPRVCAAAGALMCIMRSGL